MTDPPDDFETIRDRIREQMGGADKVRALRLAGNAHRGDFIDAFFDDGSFVELGTFAAVRGVNRPRSPVTDA